MDPQVVREYIERCRALNEFVREERRQMSCAERWRDTCALFRAGVRMADPEDDPEVAAVRERWMRLKAPYLSTATRSWSR